MNALRPAVRLCRIILCAPTSRFTVKHSTRSDSSSPWIPRNANEFGKRAQRLCSFTPDRVLESFVVSQTCCVLGSGLWCKL
ncbi:hypothetical protein AMELA_G00166190 [Ameiurus melas]|uniref:Uncharacterized protein n=1 Tax=Ameiurus melas TaxID=219545 RepID=A0A7J6AAW4_AMEME|nr:hypothetical protein AMELA_G00166190 [Ameiurus melas]